MTAEDNKALEAKPGTAEKALENEAEETTKRTVEYDGETYEFDTDDMDDVEFLYAMEQEQLATAVRILIGVNQWRKFTSKKRKVEQLNDFVGLMFSEKGATPGE